MSDERIKIAVYMDVTVSQALTLQTMFEYWNFLASAGGSRHVTFYVDGDGNFHPNCQFVNLSTKKLPRLTTEIKEAACAAGKHSGDKVFDFDGVAWYLHNKREENRARIFGNIQNSGDEQAQPTTLDDDGADKEENSV